MIAGVLGWGAGRVARRIAALLQRIDAPVLVVGDSLGRELNRLGLHVVLLTERRRRRPLPQVIGHVTRLPFASGSFGGLVLNELPQEGLGALTECARVVREAGPFVVATESAALVRRVAPPQAVAAWLLHARLVSIEQSYLGTTLLSTAQVRTTLTAPP